MIPRDVASLTTERLVLRLPRAEDAYALLSLYGDPLVMRHWIHPPWTDLAQASAAVDEARSDFAAGSALYLAIAHCAEDRLLGSCALYDIDPASRRASIGYLLARHAWGQGFGSEALRAMLGLGIDTLGLTRIEAEVAPDNGASRALLERVGFRREGILRAHWCLDGEARDVELWAFTADRQP